MRFKRLSIAAVVLSAGATCLATSSDAATAPTAETPTPAQLQSLAPSEKQLLTSGSQIDVVLDPTNGDILSVTSASQSPGSPQSVCSPGANC